MHMHALFKIMQCIEQYIWKDFVRVKVSPGEYIIPLPRQYSIGNNEYTALIFVI